MEYNDSKENQAMVQPVDDTEPEQIVTDDTDKGPVIGIVTDCMKLNIRKNPANDAEVLAVIPALTKVLVDPDASTDEFYKICTEVGINGFCMKKYIALRR